jgi:hypothetical protein
MATMERLVYGEFFLLILVAALPRRATSVFFVSVVNNWSKNSPQRYRIRSARTESFKVTTNDSVIRQQISWKLSTTANS